jgi:hypothetical protein
MSTQNASAVAITGGTITGGTITGITDLTVADGGTGASSITANSVMLGNGTSALSGNLVAPSTSGNVLTSNGTTWTSVAPAGGIGVGQSWQNLTGSRSLGTTYTNSTGRPIEIAIAISAAGKGNNLTITINGVGLLTNQFNWGSGDANNGNFMTFIIPDGHTYSVSVGNSIQTWAELR